jgi:hypothetical protein
MLTVVMPMRCQTSAARPVWRHFMPLKSARFFTGRLNQPKACGPEGRIGNHCTLRFSTFWKNSLHSSMPPPWCIQPMASIMSMPNVPPGPPVQRIEALFLPVQYPDQACAPSSTFLCEASSTSNAGTTCPAGIASIFSEPFESLPTRSTK